MRPAGHVELDDRMWMSWSLDLAYDRMAAIRSGRATVPIRDGATSVEIKAVKGTRTQCGAIRVDRYVRCPLPIGHDCKHIPWPEHEIALNGDLSLEIAARRVRA